MRATRRRAIGCAAAAATGAVLLATSIAAQADVGPNKATFRDRVGDGIKTGQMGVQLFNYGGFINNGGGQTSNDQSTTPPTPLPSPVVIGRPECAQGGAQATSADCRNYRLDILFEFLRAQGRHQRRAVRPLQLPGQRRHPGPAGLPREARRVRAARRRLARRHERGELGHPHHRGQDPRRRLHRLRRLPRPGHRQLRQHARHRRGPQPARQALGRGRPRPGVLPQPPGGVQRTSTSTTACSRRRSTSSWSAPTRATWWPRSTSSGRRTRSTTSPARRPRRSSTSRTTSRASSCSTSRTAPASRTRGSAPHVRHGHG